MRESLGDELLQRLTIPTIKNLSRAFKSCQIHRRRAAIGIEVPHSQERLHEV